MNKIDKIDMTSPTKKGIIKSISNSDVKSKNGDM